MTGTLLALLGVWALISTQWTADADAAYLQAAEVTLYAGAFFLVASTGTREAAPRVLDGIALAIVAIALVALSGRLFPGFASTGGSRTLAWWGQSHSPQAARACSRRAVSVPM